jgi:hypothetical protein
MAVFPQALSRPGRPAAALLLLLSGCVTLGSHVADGPPVSAEAPCQMVATWMPRTVQGVDVVHAGRMAVGLVGRVWLFGRDCAVPLVGDGTLTVELYTEPPAPGAPPQLLENWNLDHENLHNKCLKRDMVGWGYNLELPWSTYRPDIAHVLMRVCYKPAKGAPIYSPMQPITLSDDNQTVIHPPTTVTGLPAPGQAAAPPPAAPQGRALPTAGGPMAKLPTFRPGPAAAATATP